MSYQGGKARATFLLAVLNDPRFDGMDYLEPFCGYCHVMRRVVRKRTYTAMDNAPLLVRLLRAIQRGETLPTVKNRAEYKSLKFQRGITLKRAVACYLHSFNGKPWGGWQPRTYQRSDGRIDDIIASRLRYYERLRQSPSFAAARIELRDYQSLWPRGALVYADPPYANTLDYRARFDSAQFWSTMRTWSRHNTVFISEYEAPRDFKVVASAPKQVTLAGGQHQRTRIEKLFAHESVVARLKRSRASARVVR